MRILYRLGEKGNRRPGPIAPGTFFALGVPVTAGREFRNSDSSGAPLVAIINASLARQAFVRANPLGRTIICSYDSNDLLTICRSISSTDSR
jgi:hypothetical protein